MVIVQRGTQSNAGRVVWRSGGLQHTFAGISYPSCKRVRSGDTRMSVLELTGALSGMKRSPRHNTSREAIAATSRDLGEYYTLGRWWELSSARTRTQVHVNQDIHWKLGLWL